MRCPRAPRTLPVVLMLVAAGAIALTACGGAETADVKSNSQPEGTAAKPNPDLTVIPASLSYADIRGVIKAIDERRGRPVLLNFWATWCVPCLHEMPDLAKLAREFGDGRADFVGVSLDAWVDGDGSETEQKVRDALKEAGVGYANLIYRGDQDPLVEEFEMSGAIPYTILFAPDGHPMQVWEGRVEIEALRKALDDLC